MSDILTRDALDKFMQSLADGPRREPFICCHPIDAPFIDAIFNHGHDLSKVYDLWSECKRKWVIGGKRDIEKWQLNPLIAQYKAKLEKIKK